MKKTPLAIVKERFKDKEGLVSAVKELVTDDLWLERDGGKGLEHVSNQKLLRLHEILTQVKSQFGSRKALIDEIAKLEKRNKDEGYVARFERWPTPRLWDHYNSAKNRAEA